MSHLTQVSVKLDSLAAIKKALTEMGYGVREGKHKISAFSWVLDCDMSVLTPQGKQLMIGFNQEKDGVKVTADWWGTGVNQKKFSQTLQQLHSKHKVIDSVTKKGWKINKTEALEDGTICVVANRWS